jgi:hypothetical protein
MRDAGGCGLVCVGVVVPPGSEVEWVGGARVLVLVRDERTCAQLREFLQYGGQVSLSHG